MIMAANDGERKAARPRASQAFPTAAAVGPCGRSARVVIVGDPTPGAAHAAAQEMAAEIEAASAQTGVGPALARCIGSGA